MSTRNVPKPHRPKLARLLVWAGGASGILLGLACGFVAYAGRTWDGAVVAPRPPTRADRSPAAVARGAAIFHSTCELCHREADSPRASGAADREAPAFLGQLHAPNLTSDPVHGIGAVTDEDIARMIRYGVTRGGRRGVMPTYGMGDADIAAVLAFLRSDDPLFRPDPRPSPPTVLSTLGKAVFVASGMGTLPDRRAEGVAVPERTDSVAYGRYLAHDVLDCVGCHTPGYSPSKGQGPDAFTGGFEFERPNGGTVVSANLTPDGATGLGNFSREDFAQAVRFGLRPDGSILSAPMPTFRALDDVDVDALFTYLRSLPARTSARASREGERRALGEVAQRAP